MATKDQKQKERPGHKPKNDIFLHVICAENTIAEQLDNCVTSAGVSTVLFKLVFSIWQTVVFVKSCRFFWKAHKNIKCISCYFS